MKKAFKLIPFDISKEQIPGREQIFYVDIEQKPDYWKDVLIISSKSLEEITSISENLTTLKNHEKFKNKFVILNHYKTEEEKISYFVLEELPGEVK